MKRTSRVTLLLIAGLAATAQASDLQPLDSIRAAARTFVEGRLTTLAGKVVVEPNALDSRLRLGRCTTPLEPYLPGGTVRPGNVTVGIRCTGDQPWSLFIPVDVKVMRPVAVLVRAMTRGAVFQRSDFVLEEHDTAALRAGFIDEPGELVGMRLIHSLPAGAVVGQRHLDRPSLVKRGERVILLAGSPRFTVRMPGKALADAAAGERVRVENLSSSRVVEGRVTPDGKVRIQL